MARRLLLLSLLLLWMPRLLFAPQRLRQRLLLDYPCDKYDDYCYCRHHDLNRHQHYSAATSTCTVYIQLLQQQLLALLPVRMLLRWLELCTGSTNW